MDTSEDDRIAFITTMCQTGEAVRFGHRPIDAAAREFADLLARHGQKQFEDARAVADARMQVVAEAQQWRGRQHRGEA